MRWMVGALVALVGCGEPSDEEIAADIWTEIDGWESWRTAPAWDGIQPSSDCTHGAYVQITFNELAADAWGQDELPYGSISVKRGFDEPDGADPVGFVTVMKKIEGYDPERNDWFWLRIDDAGQPSDTAIGSASFCWSCHAAGGTDFLLTVRDEPGEGDCPE